MYYSQAGPFEESADVVVVGFGAAGAIAAITAHDEGADVLIVEKQAEHQRRPNSRFSGGLFVSPRDVDAAENYMRALYQRNGDLFETDPAVVRRWAEATSENYAWMTKMGGEAIKVADHGEHPTIPGYDSIDLYRPDMNEHPSGEHRGWGYGLFKFLLGHVEKRGIRVLYSSPAEWLLQGSDGRVVGVQIRRHEQTQRVGTGRGVVLTSGGFEFNDWLKLQNLRAYPTYFYGNPENTGDGIRMAQEVGADLWHMNSCAARFVGYFPKSGYPGGVPIDFWGLAKHGIPAAGVEAEFDKQRNSGGSRVPVGQATVALPSGAPGCVVTDRYGRRFTNEIYRAHVLYYELTNLDTRSMQLPKVPSWYIFDSRRMELGALTPTTLGPTGPLRQIDWSPDNSREVAEQWVLRADTIYALADKCGMDGETLDATIAKYNAYCANGMDPDYGRPAATLTPLDSPPFYAVSMWPGGPNTQGGPRRDPDARVLSVMGEAIPGLYSAGELGSIYGMLYPAGGGNIGECIAFGRLAGMNVAGRASRRA